LRLGGIGKGPRNPRLHVTEVSGNRLQFSLYDTDVSVANALRRIMIAEVPTLAIELVNLEENTSPLHDEFLVHRLGLLPIDSRNVRDYNYKEECPCTDSCRHCAVQFSLDVTCSDQSVMGVTHYDITALSHRGAMGDEEIPMPVPRCRDMLLQDDAILIAKLKKNQKIKCEMVAAKGIGKLHAKWIPVGTAVYQFEPIFSWNDALRRRLLPEEKRKIVNSCPRNVFDIQAHHETGVEDIVVRNKNACIFCGECEAAAVEQGHPNLLKVLYREDAFHFTVESTGCMPPEQIVEMSLEILQSKLTVLETASNRASGRQNEGDVEPIMEDLQLDLD